MKCPITIIIGKLAPGPGKGQMSVVRAAMLAIRLAGKLLDLKVSVFGL